MKHAPKTLALLISMIGMGVAGGAAQAHSRVSTQDAAPRGALGAADEAREIARVRAILGLDDAAAPAPIVRRHARSARPARPVRELTLPALAEVATFSNATKLVAAAPLPERSARHDGGRADDVGADDGGAMTAWLADLTIAPSPKRRDDPQPMLVEPTPLASRREASENRDSLLPLPEPHVAADQRVGRIIEGSPVLIVRDDGHGQIIGYDDKLMELLKVLDGIAVGDPSSRLVDPSSDVRADAPAATLATTTSNDEGARAFASIAEEIQRISIDVDTLAATATSEPSLAAFVAPSRSEELAAHAKAIPLLAKQTAAIDEIARRHALLPRVPLVDLDQPTLDPVATSSIAVPTSDRASSAKPIVVPITHLASTLIAEPAFESIALPRFASPSTADLSPAVSPLAMAPLASDGLEKPAQHALLPRIPLHDLEGDGTAPIAAVAVDLPLALERDGARDAGPLVASTAATSGPSPLASAIEPERIVVSDVVTARSLAARTSSRDTPIVVSHSRRTGREAATRVAEGPASAWFDIFDADLGTTTPASSTGRTSKASSRQRQGIVIASSLGERVAFSKLGDTLMPSPVADHRADTATVVARSSAQVKPIDKTAVAHEPATAAASPVTAVATATAPVTEIAREASPTRTSSIPLEERPNPLKGQLVALADDELDSMRAGFETPNGLQVSFGIERAVYINGALVTTQSLNVADLGRMTAGQAVQSVAGLERATLGLIQSGPNNTFNAAQAGASSVATVIQNTLDNQKIQGVTMINATVNSMDLAKRSDLQNSIQNAVTGSLRR